MCSWECGVCLWSSEQQQRMGPTGLAARACTPRNSTNPNTKPRTEPHSCTPRHWRDGCEGRLLAPPLSAARLHAAALEDVEGDLRAEPRGHRRIRLEA
eukprot:1082396-Prymnesium_polylepis.1